MELAPTINVIIPTHNRRDSLLRTLDSLGQQTFPANQYVVIVVDDGSTDDTHFIAGQQFPFNFRYVRQKQQGATVARNHGAMISQAEILVFIDDDVTISPHTLEDFAERCYQSPMVLVMGTLISRSSVIGSVYTSIIQPSPNHNPSVNGNIELHFVDCNTELLACRRSDFLDLGMFQDPTGGYGWPNWDDVDFGYRAYLNGFRLLQSSKAVGVHWDHSMAEWTIACQRWYRASRSAVWLFNRHNELQTLIPMLSDKTPLVWGKDPPVLIARKLARQLVSSKQVLAGIVKIVRILERYHPSPIVLRRLYFLLQGAYMFHGYREGLREFELAGTQE